MSTGAFRGLLPTLRTNALFTTNRSQNETAMSCRARQATLMSGSAMRMNGNRERQQARMEYRRYELETARGGQAKAECRSGKRQRAYDAVR